MSVCSYEVCSDPPRLDVKTFTMSAAGRTSGDGCGSDGRLVDCETWGPPGDDTPTVPAGETGARRTRRVCVGRGGGSRMSLHEEKGNE